MTLTPDDIIGLMITVAGLVLLMALRSLIERHFKDNSK
jgi:hypothetical protein